MQYVFSSVLLIYELIRKEIRYHEFKGVLFHLRMGESNLVVVVGESKDAIFVSLGNFPFGIRMTTIEFSNWTMLSNLKQDIPISYF